MKFNIIMDDGGVYKNCLVLVSRGIAETKRDIHINMKYERGFCICNKSNRNFWIDAKDIYEIEPLEQKIENPQIEDLEVIENDLEELFEIPEGTVNVG